MLATAQCTRSVLFGDAHSTKHLKASSAKLNLVSLMDIFTILVFFLMVNTGDVEVLQPDENILLPKSYAALKPDTAPVIKINNQMLYFKEQAIVSIADLDSKTLIQPLLEKLEAHSALLKSSEQQSAEFTAPQAISVMADAEVPYSLLKKILSTCAQAGFRDIALAVEYSTAVSTSKSGVE